MANEIIVDERGFKVFKHPAEYIKDKELFKEINPILGGDVLEILYNCKFIPSNVTSMDYAMPQIIVEGIKEDCLNLISCFTDSILFNKSSVVFKIANVMVSYELEAKKRGLTLESLIGKPITTFEDCENSGSLGPLLDQDLIRVLKERKMRVDNSNDIDVHRISFIDITKDSTPEERCKILSDVVISGLEIYKSRYNVTY